MAAATATRPLQMLPRLLIRGGEALESSTDPQLTEGGVSIGRKYSHVEKANLPILCQYTQRLFRVRRLFYLHPLLNCASTFVICWLGPRRLIKRRLATLSCRIYAVVEKRVGMLTIARRLSLTRRHDSLLLSSILITVLLPFGSNREAEFSVYKGLLGFFLFYFFVVVVECEFAKRINMHGEKKKKRSPGIHHPGLGDVLKTSSHFCASSALPEWHDV